VPPSRNERYLPVDRPTARPALRSRPWRSGQPRPGSVAPTLLTTSDTASRTQQIENDHHSETGMTPDERTSVNQHNASTPAAHPSEGWDHNWCRACHGGGVAQHVAALLTEPLVKETATASARTSSAFKMRSRLPGVLPRNQLRVDLVPRAPRSACPDGIAAPHGRYCSILKKPRAASS